MGAISSQNYVDRFHKIKNLNKTKNPANENLLDHKEKLKVNLSELIGKKASSKGSIEKLTHDDYMEILADLHNTKINDEKPETFHNLLDKAKFKIVSEGLDLFCTHIGYDKKRATEKVKAIQELVGLENSDIKIDSNSLSGNKEKNIDLQKVDKFKKNITKTSIADARKFVLKIFEPKLKSQYKELIKGAIAKTDLEPRNIIFNEIIEEMKNISQPKLKEKTKEEFIQELEDKIVSSGEKVTELKDKRDKDLELWKYEGNEFTGQIKQGFHDEYDQNVLPIEENIKNMKNLLKNNESIDIDLVHENKLLNDQYKIAEKEYQLNQKLIENDLNIIKEIQSILDKSIHPAPLKYRI